MGAEARNHHTIPQCYLRGFTHGTGKKRKLTVASLASGNVFETRPRNVGGTRDFNRIELDGYKPDALESSLANFEGEVATAIRNVSQTNVFAGEDRITILNLVALLAVRSPRQREHWRKFQEQVAKQIMSLALASRERWRGQLRQMKDAGVPIDESVPYEQVKAFHEGGKYHVTFSNEHHIYTEFQGFAAVLPYLIERKWSLFTTDEKNGLFLTTDRPVLLSWKHPDHVPVMHRRSPGFGMRDTEVLFPLTQGALLLGEFGGKEGTFSASEQLVALANTKMLSNAFEQAYLPKRTIPYIAKDGQYRHDRFLWEMPSSCPGP